MGNEFTLDNKGTYGNIMEKLINSIKLISFNYMYSSNKTLDEFGIEYPYIASAMNWSAPLNNETKLSYRVKYILRDELKGVWGNNDRCGDRPGFLLMGMYIRWFCELLRR